MEITIEELITLLNLTPHPEGGYYRETYRAEETIAPGALPSRYKGERAYGTAIYYVLTPDTFSALHRLKSDELYHFYLGDAVEMLQLLPDGSGTVIRLGSELTEGMRLQAVVPKGVWHGSRLIVGGEWALLGTTVSPGFEFADFEMGRRDALIRSYPRFRDLIVALTRE